MTYIYMHVLSNQFQTKQPSHFLGLLRLRPLFIRLSFAASRPFNLSAMDCPGCKTNRTSRFWRPSQWVRWTPVHEGYTQCKVCDKEIADYWWETSTDATSPPPPPRTPPPPTNRWRKHPPPPRGGAFRLVGDEPAELQIALQTFNSSVKHPHILEDFIETWMGMPAGVRKALSHFGAIRVRSNGRYDYTCEHTGDQFFDPTNWLYMMGFNLFFPRLATSYNWNAETKGDIIESVLGFNYYKNWVQKDLHFPFMLASDRLAALFDTVFFHLHELWQNFGDTQFMTCMEVASERSHIHHNPWRPEPCASSSAAVPRHKCFLPRIDCNCFAHVLIVD